MCFVKSFFLWEHNIDMSIAFAIIYLFDDFEANTLILLDIVEPVIELDSVVGSDYLV